MTSSVGKLLRSRSPIGSEEEVYGLNFLEMLNSITDLFSGVDCYFARGSSAVEPPLVSGLLERLMFDLGNDARLGGAGLTTSLTNAKALEVIEQEHELLHGEILAPQDYERLQAVQDILTYSLMKPYLPKYVQQFLKKMPLEVDQAVRAFLDPAFGMDDLSRLAAALIEIGKTHGNVVSATEEELRKYGPMVLTPRRLRTVSLEQLYGFPPFLIQRDVDEFVFIVLENPFLWIRKRELTFFGSMKQRYPNVSGDTMEEIVAEFLTAQQLLIDDVPPSGFRAVVRSHPHHFLSAKPIRLSRNTREDIFAVLANPSQPELQVDIVANHANGFSVLGEAKFVTTYANGERYYYHSSTHKEAEQTRLLRLTQFLNAHPTRKNQFGIPESNPVVPAFITNAVGPLFCVNDGVAKASPFEIMRVEPFYRLVYERAQTLRQAG